MSDTDTESRLRQLLAYLDRLDQVQAGVADARHQALRQLRELVDLSGAEDPVETKA